MGDGNNNVQDPMNAFNNNQSNTSLNNENANNSASNEAAYLRSIDETLKQLLSQNLNMSQSSARDSIYSRDDFRNRERNRRDTIFSYPFSGRNSSDNFIDGFEQALMDSFLGSDFKDRIGNAVNEFADAFGLNLKTIRSDLGRELGNQAAAAFKNSSIGKNITDRFRQMRDNALGNLDRRFSEGLRNYDSQFEWREGQQTFSDRWNSIKNAIRTPSGTSESSTMSDMASQAASNATSEAGSNILSSVVGSGASEAGAGMAGEALVGSVAGTAGSGAGLAGLGAAGAETAGLAAGASGAGAALAGLSAAIPPVLIAFAAVTAATLILDAAMDTITPAIEGAKKVIESSSKVMNRASESRTKNLEYEKQRLADDVETLIKYPFEILQKAADDLYAAWDNNIQKINGTQGYSKNDLYSLISSYASRLRDEGLADVISSADITENLAKVLDSGLSGYAAEEFAYLATILNKAVPTQDFFGYADEYAALAGTMIAQGKSEIDAIAYANSQIEQFASNILYASRNLAGGFTTGLQDASSVLEDSIKIAQSAKTDNVSQISGVIAAVKAITGSVAPDLASSMTEAVVKAATGGNSSDIVALRSLSGVNASNTEFLRKLSEDPQSIFTTLFTNLSNMQNMSNDAFMEVAEGLSDVFGVSMDAFARIDFNYLASAISNMNTNSGNLADNMKLLADGETTTSTEMLRIQKINEYMIDEGLAYVMDNEAARAVQQHMWEEQMNRELMESTYAVELKGSALEFLEGLKKTVENILGFLNPFMLTGKLIQLVGTANESAAQRADIKAILEATKVGAGNIKDLYNLTTTNKDLHLTGNLAELLTGHSSYSAASASRSAGYSLIRGIAGVLNPVGGLLDSMVNSFDITGLYSSMISSSSGRRKSSYTWGTIGKSQAAIASGRSTSSASLSTLSSESRADAAAEAANTALVNKLNDLVRQMSNKDKDNKLVYSSYDDWKVSAFKKINDWDTALEAAGFTESQLEQQFQSLQAQQGAESQQARLYDESNFWSAGKDFWRADDKRVREFAFWDATIKYQTDDIEATTNIYTLLLDTTNKILTTMQKELQSLHKDWTDYYINYRVYGTGSGELNPYGRQTYSYADVARIAAKEKDESYDAVHALAEALNSNIVDLHDPQVQTNALLGRILLVAEAILQQDQSTGYTPSVSDSLTALATGKF